MFNVLRWFGIFSFLVFLTACGGGGGSGGSTSGESTTDIDFSDDSDNDTVADTIANPNDDSNSNTHVGKFIDSAVEGLSYTSQTHSGETTKNGEFYYVLGEDIIFSIGDINLGTTQGKEIVSPTDFGNENALEELKSKGVRFDDTKVINIARFLQTLDDNNNLQDGIKITEDVRRLAVGKNVNFGEESSVEQIVADLTTVTLAGARNLVDVDSAIRHLQAYLSISTGSKGERIIAATLAMGDPCNPISDSFSEKQCEEMKKKWEEEQQRKALEEAEAKAKAEAFAEAEADRLRERSQSEWDFIQKGLEMRAESNKYATLGGW